MNRFDKRDRIVRGGDFSQIIRSGAFAADEVLVVNVRRQVDAAAADLDAGTARARLGISVPKKTGSAVVRNRWKRWIREAFRTQRQKFPPGIDIVVRPKREAIGSFAAVAASLPRTVRRAVRKLEQKKSSTDPPAGGDPSAAKAHDGQENSY